MKKIIGTILIIIGVIPFLLTLGYALYASITGVCFSLFVACTKTHGIGVFFITLYILGILAWYIYLIGLILIIIGIILRKKAKVNKNV